MATNYHFRAVASDGKLRTGVVHGETEKRVAAELRRQGLTPVYVGVEEKKSLELRVPFVRRGGRKDVLHFTQELSTLLNAGVPVDRALSITSELTERAVFRVVVQDVIRVLKSGKSLADSLGTKPDYFSELYVNMVRAGEASGSLAAVFERLADFERTRDDLRNYIISSMVYPALLATVGTISVIFLLTFVVPRFAQVFQDSHLKIPLPTKIMLESSKVVKTYGWMAATAIFVFITAMSTYIRTLSGRIWWDGMRLRIPVLGIALRKSEVARFARAMGTLVSNSVPLVQSIAIAGATLNNKKIAGVAADRCAGCEARRRHRRAVTPLERVPGACGSPTECRRRDGTFGFDVRPDGGDLRSGNPRGDPPLYCIVRAAHYFSDGYCGGRVDPKHAARYYEFERGRDMRRQANTQRRAQSGVTLIEMMVVVTIIALFAALVMPKMFRRADAARVTAAHAQINGFMTALGAYKLDTSTFPTTEQGLQALRVPPAGVPLWKGPYLPQEVPNDPWGRPYVYKYPGRAWGRTRHRVAGGRWHSGRRGYQR